jgi:hypothetical protein
MKRGTQGERAWLIPLVLSLSKHEHHDRSPFDKRSMSDLDPLTLSPSKGERS